MSLQYACEQENIELLKKYFPEGRYTLEINENINILANAFKQGKRKVLNYILNKIDFIFPDILDTFLKNVCEGGHKDMAIKLLDKRVNPDSGLEGAFGGNNPKLISLMIENGANINNAFSSACKNDNVNAICNMMLNHKFSLTVLNDGLLEACHYYNVKTVELLIEKIIKISNENSFLKCFFIVYRNFSRTFDDFTGHDDIIKRQINIMLLFIQYFKVDELKYAELFVIDIMNVGLNKFKNCIFNERFYKLAREIMNNRLKKILYIKKSLNHLLNLNIVCTIESFIEYNNTKLDDIIFDDCAEQDIESLKDIFSESIILLSQPNINIMFQNACAEGDIDLVHDITLNNNNIDLKSGLFIAHKQKHVKIVEFLSKMKNVVEIDRKNLPFKSGLYLIQDSTNVFNNNNVYKIGESIDFKRRFSSYKKQCKIFELYPLSGERTLKKIENLLKKEFAKHFKRETGKEYFIGDIIDMKIVFCEFFKSLKINDEESKEEDEEMQLSRKLKKEFVTFRKRMENLFIKTKKRKISETDDSEFDEFKDLDGKIPDESKDLNESKDYKNSINSIAEKWKLFKFDKYIRPELNESAQMSGAKCHFCSESIELCWCDVDLTKINHFFHPTLGYVCFGCAQKSYYTLEKWDYWRMRKNCFTSSCPLCFLSGCFKCDHHELLKDHDFYSKEDYEILQKILLIGKDIFSKWMDFKDLHRRFTIDDARRPEYCDGCGEISNSERFFDTFYHPKISYLCHKCCPKIREYWENELKNANISSCLPCFFRGIYNCKHYEIIIRPSYFTEDEIITRPSYFTEEQLIKMSRSKNIVLSRFT